MEMYTTFNFTYSTGPSLAAVSMSKAIRFWNIAFLIYNCSSFKAWIAFALSRRACFMKLVRAFILIITDLAHPTCSVQSLSRVRLFATPWAAARQASLSITDSRSLLKLMSIESLMPSSNLILCRSLLHLPPIPSSVRVFSSESTLHMRWPKYWSFSFNIISPSNEHPGLISFKIDWLDLLAVQGTLKSLLQHHSSKASVLRSAFFTVQLSHPYITTGKTIALTRWTFVDKVMSCLCLLICCLVWL